MSTRRKRRPRRAWRKAHREKRGRALLARTMLRTAIRIPPEPLKKFDASTVPLYDVPFKAYPSTPTAQDFCEDLFEEIIRNKYRPMHSFDV